MDSASAAAVSGDGGATAVTRIRSMAEHTAGVFLTFAPLWDVAGWLGALPPWWPPVSYVMIAAGILAGCVAVLLRTLQRRRVGAARGAAHTHVRGTGIELVALGVLLGAWILRGDAEIPTDPPLVGAQLIALGLLALGALLRRRGIARRAEAHATLDSSDTSDAPSSHASPP